MVGLAATSAERSLLALAHDYCRLFELAPEAVVVIDTELRLVSMSRTGWKQLTGPLSGGALDVDPATDFGEAVTVVLQRGLPRRCELERFPWGENEGAWEVSCVPLITSTAQNIAQISGVLATFNPDGERQALRRELERSNRFEALGRLAASIAHDFNNLLTGIRGSVALARQRQRVDGFEGALNAADLAAQRAAEITRQILNFARGPAHVHSATDPATVIREAVELLGCLPDVGRVRTELSVPLGQVRIAPAALHQVLINLILNAQEAINSSGGGGAVTVSACVSQRAAASPLGERRGWVQIAVSDDGPGIDSYAQKRIFEPFFTTKTADRGTGLGLSTVRQMVEQAGGWVEVQSQVARGTTFRIYLPTATEGATVNAEDLSRRETHTPQRRVLICDDETRLASLTAGLLEEFDFRPTAVGSGDEALGILRDNGNKPDVLLLDVNLSHGMSATSVLAAIAGESMGVPVILTSGFAPEDVPRELRSHPSVASYLAKPYTVEELVSAIGSAVTTAVGQGQGVPSV